MDAAASDPRDGRCVESALTSDHDASAVSLVLRGDRLPLRNAVASCFDARLQLLVIVSPPALLLYGQLLELGGQLLSVVAADNDVQFQLATPLPWLDAFGVLDTTLSGRIEHRVVSADFKSSHFTHVVAERATLFAYACNATRREVITADSDGGFKVWVLRATVSERTSSIKGFQRIHAGSRNMQYRTIYLSKDDRTILACTTSRVDAFDSTTCARVATLYKDISRTIRRTSFQPESGSLYLQTTDLLREIYKFSETSNRGRVDGLSADGVCISSEDVLAFAPVERGDSSDIDGEKSRLQGIIALDSCGRLFVGSCGDRSLELDEVRQEISVPLSSSEKFIDMHTELRLDAPRNFIVLVATSGLLVVEAVLPGASPPNRRLVTNVAGTRFDILRSEECQRLAIFNPAPPSLLYFEGTSFDIYSTFLLQQPWDHRQGAGSTDSYRASTVEGYCALSDGIVVAWSNGDVSLLNTWSGRVSMIGTVEGTPTTIAAIPLRTLVIIGTSEGKSSVWDVRSDGVSIPMCSKNLHNTRVSKIVPSQEMNDAVTILSVSCDGEVKLWHLRVVEESMLWELLVCFRTYASTISATTLMDQEFLFCGSEGGGLECWRLPLIPSLREGENGLRRRNVAVLKQPIHSIDLHLTRVCQILVEPGGAARRMSTAPSHLGEFAWVVTYDLDKVVLVWCFSTTFFFPHRKLLLHTEPRGGYLAIGDDSCCQFYAYLGRCLDRVDVVNDTDKRAVRGRLARARESASVGSNRSAHVQIERHGIPAPFTEGETHRHAAMSLKITLPTVEQVDALSEFDVFRQKSPSHASRVTVKRAVSTSLSESTVQQQATLRECVDNKLQLPLQQESSVSFEEGPLPVPREKRRTARRNQTSQRFECFRAGLPLSTLPSSFLKAKPRLYPTGPRPVTRSQEKCAVVASLMELGAQKRSVTANHDIPRESEWREETNRPGRLAIVSTNDGVLEGLRLDFQGSKEGKQERTRDVSSGELKGGDFQQLVPYFLEWSLLVTNDQITELRAACHSRSVVHEAKENRINIPTDADFDSDDVRSQLKVRAFARWYLAGDQHSRQRLRNAFLREELRFAVQDSFVIVAMKSTGCIVPPQHDFEDETSTKWLHFMKWYATGETESSSIGKSISTEAASRLKLRQSDRTAFLKRRMEILQNLDDNKTFIFDALPRNLGRPEMKSAFAWQNMSLVHRCHEIALALQNSMVEIAAIADGVDLPHQSIAAVEDDKLLVLASSFVSWWTSDENVLREEFLREEQDEAILHSNGSSDRSSGEPGSSHVLGGSHTYSSSPRSRLRIIKLEQIQRRSRVDLVSHGGDFAPPLVLESTLLPALAPFRFPTAASSTPSILNSVDFIGDGIAAFHVNEIGGTEVRSLEQPPNAIDEEDDLIRREKELSAMMAEDELSRELSSGYESGSDDDQDGESTPIEPPKRTDFTHSYFFSNLPKTFRVNAGGWIAGSGLDNGDEEIEEEERLERERQRQEMLDRLEAERIAEAERQAERLRLEREMDEKGIQLRRLRQMELRKVLLAQAELEMRRAEQIEHERMLRERQAAAEEERLTHLWLAALDAERRAMISEDELAKQVVGAERSSKRSDMRRVLSEVTQMDAEDKRSAIVQAQQLRLEQKQQNRLHYLKALYEPFDPVFPTSKEPNEDILPVIRQRPKSITKAEKHGPYVVPFSEAVVMDEVEREHHYATRDSRKLRLLMGLPLRTTQSRHALSIPTEDEIIKTRHGLQLRLPPAVDVFDEETRSIDDSKTVKPSTIHHPNRLRLPQLVRWKAQHDHHLSDMNAMMATSPSNQTRAHNPQKSRSTSGGSSDHQQRSLPFFRGNFIVEGTSRSRAYARK